MDLEKFHGYLSEVQEMVSKKDATSVQQKIASLIHEQNQSSEKLPHYDAFFQGEMLFHTGQYEQALKHYLAAKGIPLFQFFCYRASSAIAMNRGQIERAQNFAKKAEELQAGDPLIQEILYPAALEAPAQTLATDQVEIQELKAPLVTSLPAMPNLSATEMLNESLSVKVEESSEIEEAIEAFQRQQKIHLSSYLKRLEHRKNLPDSFCCVLNGWKFPFTEQEDMAPHLLVEDCRKSSGGHYIRWSGKGIVLNPGIGFIDNFHQQGFCIRDIDFVIVTADIEETYGDIKKIYELNHQLNKSLPELQIIHYYLNQRTFQKLSTALKPTSKQARNTIHNLEIFLDSPDVEKVELSDTIVLHYFTTSASSHFRAVPDEQAKYTINNLGIKLELSQGTSKPLRVGYISHMGWSPLIAHHLGYCDLLLAGFGNTDIKDYSKLAYNEHNLGYHGSSALLSQVLPQLMLLTEFGGREGDLRLEMTKKMRKELLLSPEKSISAVLPADIGMLIDLKEVSVQCSLSGHYAAPAEVRVVASQPQFGHLKYLSAKLCI